MPGYNGEAGASPALPRNRDAGPLVS